MRDRLDPAAFENRVVFPVRIKNRIHDDVPRRRRRGHAGWHGDRDAGPTWMKLGGDKRDRRREQPYDQDDTNDRNDQRQYRKGANQQKHCADKQDEQEQKLHEGLDGDAPGLGSPVAKHDLADDPGEERK